MQRRYAERDDLDAYTAELKQLLASRELSPDTRARSLAALIDALAAQKMHSAAQTTLGDTMSVLLSAVQSFGEHAGTLATALRQLPDR